MAVIQSAGSGFWDQAATWVGGVPPAGINTFNINNTHVVTVRDGFGACGCPGGTIAVGGTLQNNSTGGGANFTLTGAVAHNGTFGMAGSGSNAAPTLMTMNGCVWTCGAAAIWNIVGTLAYTAPDCKIVGNATSYFNFVDQRGITGTIKKGEFNTFGNGVGVLYRVFNPRGSGLEISDLLFQSVPICPILGVAGNYNLFRFSGNILMNQCAAYFYATTSADDNNTNGVVTIQNSTSTVNHFYALIVTGKPTLYINENGGNIAFGASVLSDSAYLRITTLTSVGSLGTSFFIKSCSVLIENSTGTGIFYNCVVDTDGLITINFGITATIVNYLCKYFIVKNLILNGTGALTLSASIQASYWQASKTINFVITGPPSSITHTFVGSVIQYEPVLYKYDLTTFLFSIQYDMTVGCPNYAALYGTSLLWTAATKTLAAGGTLIINTTGHTATGMDMAISSFAGFALATSGTATINTAQYYISFDGGVLWSAALTLAQLQTNTYIINGNTYYTDPRYNIQLRIVLTSTLGGTVQQVRITGITYNPAVTESWNVRWNFEQDEGVGFDTNNDSFHQISTHKIGVPVALDGGLTTLSGNLTKIADDAGGANFDSTTDSLWALSNAIAGIGVVVAAIERFTAWLKMMFDKYIIHKNKNK